MGPAKAVSLNVVASQVSNLCFEVGGILGEVNIKLGTAVAAFDFAGFYANLGSMPIVPGHPARLLYDFLEIQAFVQKFTLVALRAESNKAALSKAINARANAFYAKYANAPAIISRMNAFYSPSVTDSKPNRLEKLSSYSHTLMTNLRDSYESTSRTDVVKTTSSVLDSELSSSGLSNSDDQRDETNIGFPGAPQKFDAPPFGGSLSSFTVSADVPIHDEIQMSKGFTSSASTGAARDHQTIVNTDYGYRMPYIENFAQYERAQISLIDEQFAQFMSGQNLPYLAAVFQNELTSIDSDVYRTQIAYVNTILMSPIQGTVTGVFKSPGDAVRPGEPIVRVENNDVVLLVATIIYRGPIGIGSSVTVETTLFDLPGPPKTKVAGNVVAVRGLDEDDHWEVLVECNNLDGGGKPILPLGYHFDYDDTTVSIT